MFNKLVALIMTFIISVMNVLTAGCGGEIDIPEDEIRTAENAVFVNTSSAYNEDEADYRLSVDVEDEIHDISELLFGIFFEDINFAADGGLYAEMVANRSFEFTHLAKGDELYRWETVGNASAEVKKNAVDCLNENNPNYVVVTNSGNTPAGIKNTGYIDGMSIVGGENYNFSFWAKADNYNKPVTVRLLVGDKTVAEGTVNGLTDEWAEYTLTLTPDTTARQNVSLAVLIENGTVCADMISLFPENTYKNRENGLRKDLCELLEELQPKFIRFPGGCVTEGENKETQYSWKDSIATGSDGLPLLFDGAYGNVAARKQGENIWTDHNCEEDEWPCFMTYGLGFYEYFLLAEDIGAVGVPVLDAGLYCQMRGKGGIDTDSAEFRQYIQDMLDLVEFCRGDESTTWGKVRVSLGHEEPFELRYIGIGNENEGEDYYSRYQLFLDAFNEAKNAAPELYEGIELIYSSGAADATGSEMYIKSYEYAKEALGDSTDAKDFAGATDHHYYKSPEWFLKHTDYYDENNYRRDVPEMTDTIYGGAIKVFLGEYAAQSNTLKAALAEAAYMTGLERNGDIVEMAAYAPLFSSTVARHWAPDLIWFDNASSKPSVNYQVQKLFSVNQGTKVLNSTLEGAEVTQPDLEGRIGLGTWYTEAEFDELLITDNKTEKTLYYTDFNLYSFKANWENVNDGNFKIRFGKLLHKGTGMNYCDTGDIAYLNYDFGTSDYTMTVDATKKDGDEGFLVAFAVGDKQNNWFWNIGGWHNTLSCLQHIENGSKTGKVAGTVKDCVIETGKTYQLKVVVSGTKVKCYIDDELYVDYDTAAVNEAESYQVAVTDDTGDIILKLVNTTYQSKTFAINLENSDISGTADVETLSGNSPADENLLWAEDTCSVENHKVIIPDEKFNYTVPAYSVTVMRIHQKDESVNNGKTTINTENRFQTLDGFGASACWWAQEAGGWENSSQIAELLYGKEDGIGLNIYRYNVGAGSEGDENLYVASNRTQNFIGADGETDFTKDAVAQKMLAEAKQAAGDNLRVTLFSNSAPVNMTINGKAYSSPMTEGGAEKETNLSADKYDDYADYYYQVAKYFSDEGYRITAVSPVNEPQYTWRAWYNADGSYSMNQEGCYYTAEQARDLFIAFVNRFAGTELDNKGVKVEMFESGEAEPESRPGGQYMNVLFSDSAEYGSSNETLRNYTNTVTTHSYWSDTNTKLQTAWFLEEKYPDMKVACTEYCQMANDRNTGVYNLIEQNGMSEGLGIEYGTAMAKVIVDDLTILNATEWNWWVGCSFGAYTDGLVYLNRSNHEEIRTAKRLWCLGNFSKFTDEGSVRIEAASGNENLPCVAFLNTDYSVTVVYVNSSDEAISTSVATNNNAAFYLTDATHNLESVSLNIADFEVPAQSVLTVVLSGDCD